MNTSFRTILSLGIAVVFLTGYNFMTANWTPPTGTAPANNVDAPLNTGTTTQTKNGSLVVSNLAASAQVRSNTYCNSLGTLCPLRIMSSGYIEIAAGAPTIKMTDTDAKDVWMHVNDNTWYILGDRNDDGTWTGESPWPLMVRIGDTPADDWVSVNQMRSPEYCDESGNNCFDPAVNMQARTCPSNQFMRGVNADGSLVCATATTSSGTSCTTNTKTVSGCYTSPPSSISCGTGWSKTGGINYTGISCSTNGIRYTQNCIQTVCS